MNHVTHTLSSADISIFSPEIILLYQETQIEIALSSNSVNFSWVFNYFFNKPSYNFDDISKNSYPRSS